MKNKWTQYFLIFLREWGLFILFITFFLLTRLFLWLPVKVDGHSMDPTLANNQRVIVLKHTSIERFDIVVAKEVEDGKTKQIVKRVILSLIHISEPTRHFKRSRMPSSA